MQQQQQKPGMTPRGTLNLLYLLASAHATCFTVFTRHSFGVEAFGINGVAALVLILAYICFTSSQAMVTFLGIWMFMLVAQRLRTFWCDRKGWVRHSLYDGYPWLGFMVPLVRRVQTAKMWELSFCTLSGALLCDVDWALGQFVVMSFFSLLFKVIVEAEITRKRLQSMRDAELEMRNLAELYNQSRF